MCFGKSGRFLGFPLLFLSLVCSSCSRQGWGVLLWATEEPPIPSGTVLPVYIRSNIDKVWVLGVPKAFRDAGGLDKVEVPLARFELAGGKRKAERRARDFARYARTYAENLQDGLPIRDGPDNGGRRVYRLRTGEIIKILERVEGNPAIGAGGEPLPGDWYRVLTAEGSTGYCFSYRLKLFEHWGGALVAAPVEREEAASPELDALMAKVWSPESYGQMLANRRVNTEELARRWGFYIGQDTGIAHIYLPDMERSFSYSGIRPDGDRAWRFEGTSLRMNLRSDTALAVQFADNDGATRTLLFTALPAGVDDLIMQENARREALFYSIYNQGPVFTSNNYGTIVFTEDGEFGWSGFDLLVPQVIPERSGGGRVAMDLFLTPSFEGRYNGACTFYFDGPRGETAVRFMYILDSQGFRLELVPDYCIEDGIVTRRDSSPVVLYFFRDEFSGIPVP
ncbi:MAG: SH3 domain-containing protein [Treponema sp.]|jgi:hypothetical protein|nr:SH3 domain-containing protein [Treponema sp.]